MRLQRFFGEFQFVPAGEILITDDSALNQFRNVFRFKAGDKVVLCDNNLNEALCEIKDLRRDQVKINILEVNQVKNEPTNVVRLYCAILKSDHFDLVVQKATEVGVTEIIPLITTRTVKTNLHPERLEKIIKEAGEQSGRGRLPILSEPVALAEALAEATGEKMFFDGSGSKFRADEVKMGELNIFIGPEGGWEPGEVELAIANNCKIVSLGSLTLRAETAAIVSSYLAVRI